MYGQLDYCVFLMSLANVLQQVHESKGYISYLIWPKLKYEKVESNVDLAVDLALDVGSLSISICKSSERLL